MGNIQAKVQLQRIENVSTADVRATEKEKKRRQEEKMIRVRREEALREAEGTTYEAGAF